MSTMMRLRGWLGVVAALSVLLNAGALVRHDLVMGAAGWQARTLLADIAGSLCRAAADTRQPADTAPARAPAPSDVPAVCPVCLGLAAAFILAHALHEPQAPPTGARIADPAAEAAPPALPRTARPPVRGPPPARA
jgi:hypothetical protein